MKKQIFTEQEIQKVVEQYADMLIRIGFLYMKNMSDAQDAAQDTFVKLIENGNNFENEEHEKAWLIRVLTNCCKDHLKSAWYRKKAQLDETLCMMDKRKSELLLSVMGLPIKYRKIIILYYYEDYSIKEIAQILKIKETTINSQLQRARKLLKSNLTGGIDYE